MTTTPRELGAADAVLRGLRGRRVDARNLVFEALLLLGLLITLLFLVVLLVEVVRQGMPVLFDRGLGFFTSGPSTLPERAGIRYGLIGSGLLMAVVVVIAFPLGIGAAIYLEEYAPDSRLTRFIDINIRNLAGVPSIVYGLLGFAIFVQALGGATGGRTILAGGLTLAALVLPIVIITASEAIRAVPDSIREAGFGVGATKWEVVRGLVLPSAAPGILTGTILSLSRALGETAPLILVGAVTGFLALGSQTPLEAIRSPYTALPIQIFSFATKPDQDFIGLTNATIIVLLGAILLANTTAIILRNRYERKW